MRLQKTALLLVVSLIVFSSVAKADCKNKLPTKADIEKVFGKPTDITKYESGCVDYNTGKKLACRCDSEEYICYGKGSAEARVKFDDSNKVETIEIYSGDSRNAIRLLYGELTEKTWNKFNEFIKQGSLNPADFLDGCSMRSKYSNDCFEVIIASPAYCTNSAPMFITINWKN